MKKLSLYLLLSLIAGWSLTSCDESHSDFVEPEVYPQEEVLPGDAFDDFDATPTAEASQNINLDTLVKYNVDSIQLFTLKMGTLPAGYVFEDIRLEAWPSDKTENISTNVPASKEGKISKEDLAALVYTFYGKKATERTFTAKLFGNVKRGIEAQLITLGDFTLKITPQEVENPYYYIYGKATSSKAEEAYKTVMTPDPESDVIFTYTTKFASSGDVKVWNSKYWADGHRTKDFSKLYGSGEDKPSSYKGLTGKIQQGSTSSIFSPTKEYYTFRIDLEELTYEWIKLEDQDPTAYTIISLIGIGGDWNTDVDMTVTDNGKHNWFAEVTLTANTQLKFRANHEWTTSWGFGSADGEWTVNDDIWAKTCEIDAKNIAVPAGHYYIYFCDITGAAHFVPVD